MKPFFVCLLGLVCCVSLALSAPFEQRVETDPELTAGYFEGDMILNEQRNGLVAETARWPDNTVYYKMDDKLFDASHREYILMGMKIIESVSCIRFKPATDDMKAYVKITSNNSGCSSSVGFMNRTQNYNLKLDVLDAGCFRLGVIVHEFLHTLGLYHMQSASNRDDYVHIVRENITPIFLQEFKKYDEDKVDNYDQEYDYDSILHYAAYAFSKNGQKTILPLNGDEEVSNRMGQRIRMTTSDINRLNVMYKCVQEI